MHQVALVAFNKMIVRHRDSLIQYRKSMAAFILKTEVRLAFISSALVNTFLQNAVDLEVAKLHLTDQTDAAKLRSQIRRRLFASSIPMRPWFPLSIDASELKVMLQDALIAQRKIVSICFSCLPLFIS
jgi:hypothetical protein